MDTSNIINEDLQNQINTLTEKVRIIESINAILTESNELKDKHIAFLTKQIEFLEYRFLVSSQTK